MPVASVRGLARRGRRVSFATAICVALCLATPAWGARNIVTGLSDPLYLSGDDALRATWLDRTVDARAGLIRINVVWRNVVHGRPEHPRNPADPAYRFGAIDASVQAAAQHGLAVMLTFLGAPKWAQGAHRPHLVRPGAWKPKPRPFGSFVHAVAKRYSGGFGAIPRVRDFEAWNEPNLTAYLAPQWHRNKAVGPRLYRGLLNAAYEAAHAVHADNRVIAGSTAPFGEPTGGDRMRPIRFLQGLFCLGGGCKQKPHLDVLAHHPIDRFMGPGHHAISPMDATIPDMGRVGRVLREAQRAHTVRPGGKVPLWVTEFWWESDPPDHRYGIPVQRQARWIETALHLFWKAGVKVAVNLQIRDSKRDSQNSISNLQAGTFFYSGKPKPSYTAFRFPFVTDRRSAHSIDVWGKSPATGELLIQRRDGGRWHRLKTIHANAGRVFASRLHLRGGARLRAKVGGETSLPWHQRR